MSGSAVTAGHGRCEGDAPCFISCSSRVGRNRNTPRRVAQAQAATADAENGSVPRKTFCYGRPDGRSHPRHRNVHVVPVLLPLMLPDLMSTVSIGTARVDAINLMGRKGLW